MAVESSGLSRRVERRRQLLSLCPSGFSKAWERGKEGGRSRRTDGGGHLGA